MKSYKHNLGQFTTIGYKCQFTGMKIKKLYILYNKKRKPNYQVNTLDKDEA